MNLPRKFYKYIIAWVISLALFLYLTLDFLEIVVTFELVLAGMGYALLSTALFRQFTKKKIHFGLMPSLIGFNLLLVSGGLLFGALSWESIDKESWWTIPDVTKKTYLGIIAFVGFMLFMFGTREMARQWYWLRPGGGKRPF